MSKLFPTGVFSAAATPFGADGGVDHFRLTAHCLRLIEQGCHGIALLGSTGEANSLSVAERMATLERVIEGGVPSECLLPGTGVCALPETVALTRHALSLGVETVVMLPPFYYKAVDDGGLVDAYSHVVEAVGDPRLKIVLYHIPPISQMPLSPALIGTLRERFPATFVGIKDSGGALDHMLELVRNFPGLAVLAGADPLLRPLLEAGGAGCITATSNIVAADLRIVFDHFADPAKAEAVASAQARIVAMRDLSNRYAQIPTVKAMIACRTGEEGWCRVRPPFRALGAEEQRIVAEHMGGRDLRHEAGRAAAPVPPS